MSLEDSKTSLFCVGEISIRSTLRQSRDTQSSDSAQAALAHSKTQKAMMMKTLSTLPWNFENRSRIRLRTSKSQKLLDPVCPWSLAFQFNSSLSFHPRVSPKLQVEKYNTPSVPRPLWVRHGMCRASPPNCAF